MGPPSEDGGNRGPRHRFRRAFVASMGPPSEDGGNAWLAQSQEARQIRFNGAAVRRRRKSAILLDATVETSRFNGAAVRRRRKFPTCSIRANHTAASMGPPSEDGGNKKLNKMPAVSDCVLQWGRRPKTAEICLARRQWQDLFGLQWGRRPKTAEILRFSVLPPMARWLQWGRRPKTAEIYVYGTFTAPALTLQWGRRPKTAEMNRWNRSSGAATASMGPPSEDGGNLAHR